MNFKICKLTLSGKIKKSLYINITSWVKKLWDNIDINLIKKSFKCYDISVTRDGSKDNLVFNYNGLKNKKSKKTEQIIDINDEKNQNSDEKDSHNSDIDDINKYKEQEIAYDNKYN